MVGLLLAAEVASMTDMDKIEFYLVGSEHPFESVFSSFAPIDGDLVNIRKVTYLVVGRSLTMDTEVLGAKKMRCNVIVKKAGRQKDS